MIGLTLNRNRKMSLIPTTTVRFSVQAIPGKRRLAELNPQARNQTVRVPR